MKISELPASAALTGAERLPLVQDGETRQAALSSLVDNAAAAAPVQSVSGKTGAVSLTIADTSGLQEALNDKASLGGNIFVAAQFINEPSPSTDARLKIQQNSGGNALLDLCGDLTYTTYGFRIRRFVDPASGTQLASQGPGPFRLEIPHGGAVLINSGTDDASGARLQVHGNCNLRPGYVYSVGGEQVLGARKTGWGAPTGTATRSTFATDSVTLLELARRVKALIDDLRAHGLIQS